MSDLKSETEEERWMRRAFESLHKPIPDNTSNANSTILARSVQRESPTIA